MQGSLVVDILAAMRNEDTLMEAGVSAVDPHAPWLLNKVCSLRVMEMAATYSRKLFADFIVFQRFYGEDLPGAFLLLPSATGDEPYSWLNPRTCGALRWVRKWRSPLGTENRRLGTTNCGWPHLPWCRECCVALNECKFERVPDDVFGAPPRVR